MLRGLWRLTWLEIKIFVREPMGVIGTIAVPVLVFVVLARLLGPRLRTGAPARVRAVRLQPRRVPTEAVNEVLAQPSDDRHRSQLTWWKKRMFNAWRAANGTRRLHMLTTQRQLTSPFARAAVLVCDTDADRELSLWKWRRHGRDRRAVVVTQCVCEFVFIMCRGFWLRAWAGT